MKEFENEHLENKIRETSLGNLIYFGCMKANFLR